MNKPRIAKQTAQIAVGIGASKIALTIIKSQVPTDTLYQKLTVGVAALVIGSMTSDMTVAHFNAQISRISAYLQKQEEIRQNSQVTV